MTAVERYSEPYQATGGLAAVGVLNQLGRPDIEPLEVLVREAVQNCWDARRPDARGIRVEIGRRQLDTATLEVIRRDFLVSPPPGLPLDGALQPGASTMYFADFGTRGLGGPTRADELGGDKRDFVDFIRNIGQPPDNDLGGGSFGYGKAAFFIASRARTVVIDTLCFRQDGALERRLIGCALGDNFEERGAPFTGRHWWGQMRDGVPEPVLNEEADALARMLGLPDRAGADGLGTTVLMIAPEAAVPDEDDSDVTMEFIAEALAWNFWPRMITTRGGVSRSMEFKVADDGRRVPVPDPRTHERLRGFVEAMDRLREEPDDDDDWTIDRSVRCLKPVQQLGRVVITKGPVAPVTLPERPVPQGARETANAVHHVALMRNAELIVKYLRGSAPTNGRLGYSGVFQCAKDVDESFRRAEPPTHDDWRYQSIVEDGGYDRRFVKVALDRVARICREAAGYDTVADTTSSGDGIPLGEFADSLATLMPGFEGPGARRMPRSTRRKKRKRTSAPGRSVSDDVAGEAWVPSMQGGAPGVGADSGTEAEPDATATTGPAGPQRPRLRAPQTRAAGEPELVVAEDGVPVVRYPFDLRVFDGARVRLRATVEVMTNDGGQVEPEPPRGHAVPAVRAWITPGGVALGEEAPLLGPDDPSGTWRAEVPLSTEAMLRVDINPEIA